MSQRNNEYFLFLFFYLINLIEYKNGLQFLAIKTTTFMFSLLLTLIFIPYRYCERLGSHNA